MSNFGLADYTTGMALEVNPKTLWRRNVNEDVLRLDGL
jgi:hypothetical protein